MYDHVAFLTTTWCIPIVFRDFLPFEYSSGDWFGVPDLIHASYTHQPVSCLTSRALQKPTLLPYFIALFVFTMTNESDESWSDTESEDDDLFETPLRSYAYQIEMFERSMEGNIIAVVRTLTLSVALHLTHIPRWAQGRARLKCK